MTETDASQPTNRTSGDTDIYIGTVQRRPMMGRLLSCPARSLCAPQADRACTATSKSHTSALVFYVRNGASDTEPALGALEAQDQHRHLTTELRMGPTVGPRGRVAEPWTLPLSKEV